VRRRAQVRISAELLPRILHLREGITVTDVLFDRETETVRIYLEGAEFPEVQRRNSSVCYNLIDLMYELG
jgi:hypothetical protein